jgi:hypothetical protein
MYVTDDAVERAASWLQIWDSQDIHRTATNGDAAGAKWLLREARQLDVPAIVETFEVDRLDPVAAFVEIGNARIEGVPVFDAPATGADGVTGALGPIGSSAPIGVVELSPHAVYSQDYERLRCGARHQALVIIARGMQPGLGLLNAERFCAPYGAPAIQVSSACHEMLSAAAERGAPATMVAESRRISARASNIVVTISGRDARHPPVVVMTPRSSWWQSTAERGGGIVCWLESLRALTATPPGPDVVLTANTGHELGHLGLDDFLARRPRWEKPVNSGGALWVHYGANIGTAGGQLSLLSNAADLTTLAARELTRSGQRDFRVGDPDHVPSGETRDIHRAGGSYLTLVGTNPWFHLPEDRWPHSLDVAAIARIAAGAAAMVVSLTR